MNSKSNEPLKAVVITRIIEPLSPKLLEPSSVDVDSVSQGIFLGYRYKYPSGRTFTMRLSKPIKLTDDISELPLEFGSLGIPPTPMFRNDVIAGDYTELSNNNLWHMSGAYINVPGKKEWVSRDGLWKYYRSNGLVIMLNYKSGVLITPLYKIKYIDTTIVDNNTLSGGCKCRGVTYSVPRLPMEIARCHCTICREFTEKPYSTFAKYDYNDVNFEQHNGSLLQSVASSSRAVRGFCKKCKTYLYMQYVDSNNIPNYVRSR